MITALLQHTTSKILFTMASAGLLAVAMLGNTADANWLSHGSWHRMCRAGDQLTVHFIKNSSFNAYEYGGVSIGNKGGRANMIGKTSEYVYMTIPANETTGTIGIGTYDGGGKGGSFELANIPTCIKGGILNQ